MIARDTRTFMAMLAIAQHFGRPSTPTAQAWIESLNGTIKAKWPHLLAIDAPAVLRAGLDTIRVEYNSVTLHSGSGFVPPTTNTPDAARPSAPPAAKDSTTPEHAALPTTDVTEQSMNHNHLTRPRCGLINRPKCDMDAEPDHPARIEDAPRPRVDTQDVGQRASDHSRHPALTPLAAVE